MRKALTYLTLAISAACLSASAAAQDGAEEERTTYQVSMLKLDDGAQDRWMEIMEKNLTPALAAAGLPAPQVHWVMAGPWDILVISEMPDGLGSLDQHVSPTGASYQAALQKQLGSEAAVEALNKELDKLVVDSQRTFTHTHP